jgi:hypothetical protein
MKLKKIIILSFIILIPLMSFALNPEGEMKKSYNLLEPISAGAATVKNPGSYIQSIYWYMIGLTIAFSVLMIIVGGLQYSLTWASASNKGEAQSRIENAIIGLVIALMAYLLLYTINPDLVELKIKKLGESCDAPATTIGSGSSAPAKGNVGGKGN